MIHYHKGDEDKAKKAFEEAIKLNANDKQVKFLLERLEK